ncbi:phosphotransferase [Paenibacillus fonticola]|uniref:phosphotransferase n=1 Tax=Paenibacillus fonticola TaxID=379896 RepID=UPI000684E559|nr:phosphotransferase [Paenibacillus fonticola]
MEKPGPSLSQSNGQANQTNLWTRRWFERFAEACIQFSERTWAELKTPEMANLLRMERISPALIHSDITTHNVIIADDGQLFIIDWDHSKLGSIYVDLATTLMNTTHFNPVFMHSLLKGYEALRPLNHAERKLTSALYRLPREAWHAARFPDRPRSRNMLDIMEQTWLPRLKGMVVLDEWANQDPSSKITPVRY